MRLQIFSIHIALAETVLGSQGTFIASRTMLTCWRGAVLVSAKTVLDSHRICLALPETIIGLQSALFVSTETCFQELAKGALATLTSLRKCRELVLPSERSCSNLSWSK